MKNAMTNEKPNDDLLLNIATYPKQPVKTISMKPITSHLCLKPVPHPPRDGRYSLSEQRHSRTSSHGR